MKRVNVNADQMQVFLTKNNAEMKINVCECKELIYKVLIKY